MKKYFTRLLFLFYLNIVSAGLNAQVSKNIISLFPAAIVYRVQEVCEMTNLPEYRQLSLAIFFKKQDSLANIAVANATWTQLSLKPFYQSDPQTLKSLLSPMEFNDYKVNSGSTSALRKVVSLRNELALDSVQVSQFLKEQYLLEDSVNVAGFDASAMEKRVLSKVLTKPQYLDYFTEINRKTAAATAMNLIIELKNTALLKTDSARTYAALIDYELKRTSTLAYNSHMDDRTAYDINRDLFEAIKPAILYRLEAQKKPSAWYRLLCAAHYSKELHLSEYQITLLLEQYRVMRRLEYERRLNSSKEKFDKRRYENRELSRTLNREQLNAFFRILNQSTAERYAKENIDKLNAYKLLANLDKKTIDKELFEYEMRLLLTREKSYFSDDEKIDAFARQDILDHKPEILKRLETAIEQDRESKIVRF